MSFWCNQKSKHKKRSWSRSPPLHAQQLPPAALTVVTGAIPTRIIFLTALETTKAATFRLVEPFKLSEPTQGAIANGVAGMAAAVCSQAVFVPIDVVSQKLMVQGYSGHATYNGGLDARKVLKVDGIRGLYRGFGLSVLTYSPSSAVWWASYGSSQRLIWRFLGHGSTEHEESAPSPVDDSVYSSCWRDICWCHGILHHNSIGHYLDSLTGHGTRKETYSKRS